MLFYPFSLTTEFSWTLLYSDHVLSPYDGSSVNSQPEDLPAHKAEKIYLSVLSPYLFSISILLKYLVAFKALNPVNTTIYLILFPHPPLLSIHCEIN